MISFVKEYGILPAMFYENKVFSSGSYLPYCTWQHQHFTMIQRDYPGDEWWEEKVSKEDNWKSGEEAWK